jgi:hypothetical protein
MLQAANELKKEINYHFKNNVLPTARKLQLLIEQSENAEIFLPETSLLKQVCLISYNYWLIV